ncbi:unnamed protein product [Dicrocoelium dendriticum]|nr:unnamed protein product [Dicrocoelium dendriticum]
MPDHVPHRSGVTYLACQRIMAVGKARPQGQLNAGEYLLNYTLKELEGNMFKIKSNYMKELGDSVSNIAIVATEEEFSRRVLQEKLKLISENSTLLESARTELELIRHAVAYRKILEGNITKTLMRFERLKEEHQWLCNELQYLEQKTEQEEKQSKTLRRKIAHTAFVYNQRRSWNEYSLPMEWCGLSSATESPQNHGVQVEDLLARMHPKLPYICRINTALKHSLTDTLDGNHENNESLKEGGNNEQIKNYSQDSMSGESEHLTEGSESNSTVKTKKITDRNSSNSAKLSLLELKHLMLDDNAKETKKVTMSSPVQRKSKVSTGRGKSPKVNIDMHTEWQLSDLDKETIKQCMKTLKLKAPTKECPVIDNEGTLEEQVDEFVRSNERSQRLNCFMELVNQFNYRETRSPGIGLCWLAVLSLKRFEKELRNGKTAVRKRTSIRLRSSKRPPTPSDRVGVVNSVEHQQVVEDLCRLLSFLSCFYKSKNEFSKAAECLREFIKLRRLTRTWKQVAVAQALHNLSCLQSLLKDCDSAIINARKALQLRRDLLASDPNAIDLTGSQLAVARQLTHMALLLMNKQQAEQKRLRYHRFPFRDVADVPVLLNESIGIITSLMIVYANSLSLINDDLDMSTTDVSPSTVGDSGESKIAQIRLNPIDECLMVSRNALSIYYICTKKWNKAQRVLQQNLSHMDRVMPDERFLYVGKGYRVPAKLIKLTCLKCIFHVLKVTEQGAKQPDLLQRIVNLDPYYRQTDEMGEDDMIRMCQNSIFG